LSRIPGKVYIDLPPSSSRRVRKVHLSDDNTYENIRCHPSNKTGVKEEDTKWSNIYSKCTCAKCIRSKKKDKKLIMEARRDNPAQTKGRWHPSDDMAKLHTPHRVTCKAAQMVKEGKWLSIWSGIIRADKIIQEYRSVQGRLVKNRKTLWYIIPCNDYNCPGMKLVSAKVLQDVPGVGL